MAQVYGDMISQVTFCQVKLKELILVLPMKRMSFYVHVSMEMGVEKYGESIIRQGLKNVL